VATSSVRSAWSLDTGPLSAQTRRPTCTDQVAPLWLNILICSARRCSRQDLRDPLSTMAILNALHLPRKRMPKMTAKVHRRRTLTKRSKKTYRNSCRSLLSSTRNYRRKKGARLAVARAHRVHRHQIQSRDQAPTHRSQKAPAQTLALVQAIAHCHALVQTTVAIKRSGKLLMAR